MCAVTNIIEPKYLDHARNARRSITIKQVKWIFSTWISQGGRYHHEMYFFLLNLGRSFHIWYQIEAACNILAFSIWPPFWRYSKLFFLPEEISEVNHNRTMSHNQCCISFFFFFFWGGGIDIGIGDVTLVRMFKSLIWMTHYFSSKLNVLGISKYIFLLLDILATIHFLFLSDRSDISRNWWLCNFTPCRKISSKSVQ